MIFIEHFCEFLTWIFNRSWPKNRVFGEMWKIDHDEFLLRTANIVFFRYYAAKLRSLLIMRQLILFGFVLLTCAKRQSWSDFGRILTSMWPQLRKLGIVTDWSCGKSENLAKLANRQVAFLSGISLDSGKDGSQDCSDWEGRDFGGDRERPRAHL